MEFGLSPEESALQESVFRYLESTFPLHAIKKITESGAPFSSDAWHGFADLGALSIAIPESHGGSGLGFFSLALAAEGLGAFAAPLPALGSMAASLAIAEAGSEEEKSRWLPKIAQGETKFGLVLSEAAGAREDAGVRAEGKKLFGRALFVMDGPLADQLLVSAGKKLFIVPAKGEGMESRTLSTIDKTRGFSEVRFSGALGEPLAQASEETTERLLSACRVLLAADTLGAAQTMLNRAVAYALERKQFDRVIASFQAVKHLLAEMAAMIEPARALVMYAAYAWENIPQEAKKMACHAKAHLAEIGREVARMSTEVHGGIGFTYDLGLHFWFKRIGVNRELLGTPETVREEAARCEGWI